MVTPLRATGQVARTITACTPDALNVCADVRLTAGANFFEIGIRALVANGAPTQPISIYNLILGTGGIPAAMPVATDLVPSASGGATISDFSPWELYDAGDVLFLSALSNRGVGGCVFGADVDGFGQAAATCGVGQFITFGFMPTAAFDPFAFSILNLEAVVLADPSQGSSCGADVMPCTIIADIRTPDSPTAVVPEPTTLLMIGVGLATLFGIASRRRMI